MQDAVLATALISGRLLAVGDYDRYAEHTVLIKQPNMLSIYVEQASAVINLSN